MGNELFLEINDNSTQGSHATSPDLAFIERRMTNPRWLLQQFLESSEVKSNHCWRFSTISHTTTYTKKKGHFRVVRIINMRKILLLGIQMIIWEVTFAPDKS